MVWPPCGGPGEARWVGWGGGGGGGGGGGQGGPVGRKVIWNFATPILHLFPNLNVGIGGFRRMQDRDQLLALSHSDR